MFIYRDGLRVQPQLDPYISVESEHFRWWAKDNHMTISLLKTKEIVFCKPSARSFLPPCLTGIERVVSAKLLGVTFCSNSNFLFLLILYRFSYVMFCSAMAFDRCLIKDYLLT